MDPNVFEGYLKDYFLTEDSLLADGLHKLSLARQNNLLAKVSSFDQKDLHAFELIGKNFGIRIEDGTSESMKSPDIHLWLNGPKRGTVRIKIPTEYQRLDDFRPLFLFHFELALAEYRNTKPEPLDPSIDITYLLLVMHLAFESFYRMSIEDIVFKDFLELGQRPHLTIENFSNSSESKYRAANSFVRGMPLISQMYTGFAPLKMRDIPFWDEAANKHPLNLEAYIWGSKENENVTLLKRPFCWTLPQLGTVLKNLDLHKREKEELDSKVKLCLIERLKGKSEEEVCKRLGFTNPDDYNKWLKENLINFEAETGWSQVEKRETARKELGLPTDLEIDVMARARSIAELKRTPASEAPMKSEKARELVKSISNALIFGPDFRFISVSGRPFESTPKQASVLEFFYNNWQQGILYLAQGTVLQEVYGESSHSSLKEAFDNDNLYDLIFKSGNRKGMVGFKEFAKIVAVNWIEALE